MFLSTVHSLDYDGSLDILVKNIEFHLMSDVYIYFCDWHHSSFNRRQKMKRPTLRSTTSPTTRHRQQPPRRKGMAPTSPCLQWRPRSVDRCSASPGSGRGWGNNKWVLYYNGWGLHTVGAFSVIPGVGMGMGVGGDTSPGNRWNCFSHRATFMTLPLPRLPHLPQENKPICRRHSWLALNM